MSAAKKQIGVATGDDPEYRQLAYPGGDVPIGTGVCTIKIIGHDRSSKPAPPLMPL